MHTYMHVYTYIHTCTYAHTCIHICIDRYIHTYMEQKGWPRSALLKAANITLGKLLNKFLEDRFPHLQNEDIDGIYLAILLSSET